MSSEIGRELKVSELHPPQVVVLKKLGRPLATVWVRSVDEHFVEFYAGEVQMTFMASRDGDGIRDDDMPIKIYEYLGK